MQCNAMAHEEGLGNVGRSVHESVCLTCGFRNWVSMHDDSVYYRAFYI